MLILRDLPQDKLNAATQLWTLLALLLSKHPGKYQLLMSQDEEQTLKIFIMNKFRLFVVAEEKQIHKIPEGALET